MPRQDNPWQLVECVEQVFKLLDAPPGGRQLGHQRGETRRGGQHPAGSLVAGDAGILDSTRQAPELGSDQLGVPRRLIVAGARRLEGGLRLRSARAAVVAQSPLQRLASGRIRILSRAQSDLGSVAVGERRG
jgi:hypothetical protein